MAEGGFKKAVLSPPTDISVGSGTTSVPIPGASSYAALCYNSLFSPNRNDDKKLAVFKRPGIGGSTSDANFSFIYNFYNWVGYAAAGQLVYFGVGSSVDKMCISGVTTYSHADSTKINYVTEMLNSSGTSCLVWTRSSDAWIYPKGGAVAQLSSVPATMSGGLINIDGWTFVACNTTNGARIYNSSLNDPTAGYSDYVAVNIHPDTLVTVYKYKNFCLAFGTDSLEWFQVSDNEFGSPLKRIPQYFSRIGLLAPADDIGVPAICEGNDTIYWIGKGSHVGMPQVYTMEGTSPKKISSTPVELMLQYHHSLGDLAIKYVTIQGCKLLLIRAANEKALVYHIDVDKWSVWHGTNINWGSATNFNSLGNTVHISKSDAGTYGTMNQAASASSTDLGSTMDQTICFKPENFGTHNKKIAHRARLLMLEGIVTPYSLQFGWLDDLTGANIQRTVSSTALGALMTSNLGSFRERTFYIINYSTVAIKLEGLEIEYEVLDD